MRHILLRMASFCYLWPQLQGASFNYHQSTGHLPLAAIGKGKLLAIAPERYRQLFTRFTGCTDSKDLSLAYLQGLVKGHQGPLWVLFGLQIIALDGNG